MRIVITEFMNEAALASFPPAWFVHYDPALVDDRAATLREAAEADALIVRNRTQVDAGLLAAAPRLRAVGRLGVGLDNIDLEACAARGVSVHPATGANTRSVAEYVIGAMLMLTRGAYLDRPAMEAGDWPRARLGAGGEVLGRVLGLWGYGAIAQAIAGLARPLGLSVIAHDPFLPVDAPAWGETRPVSAATLLQSSDILSLHVPLTAETRGLIGAAALEQMKPGAILINTARGEVVDAGAVADALRAGALGGAALDVFAKEPLPQEAAATLVGAPNLILTPHIAGVTAEGNVRVSELTVQNVIEALS